MKKPLTYCVNGDGRLVQPPSWVLCKECLEKLSERFYALARDYGIARATAPEPPR